MTETLKLEEISQQKAPASGEKFLSRIMVATDFSAVADRALDFAVSLARRFGARIYLAHVVNFQGRETIEPNLGGFAYPKPWELAEQNAKAIVDSGRLAGLTYEVILEEGNLWPELESLIEKNHIDLLVVGTQGLSGARKTVFGSAAEQIFRQAQIPVLTVGPAVIQEPQFEAEFRSVLFATDFGTAAEREAAFAFAIAQEHRAKLMLLNVTPFRVGVSESDALAERSLLTRQLQELVPQKAELHCKPEIHVAYGAPVEEILRVARETKADLIVIGAKKAGSFSGHLPATTAYGVVRGAGCPVLTIRS